MDGHQVSTAAPTAGTVIPYPGGYDYFLEKTGGLANERAAITAG